MSENLKKCPYCKSNNVLEENDVKICMMCGFQTSFLYHSKSDALKKLNTTGPKIIKSIKKYDPKLKQYWVPSIINIPNKGMVFPEGNDENWQWAFAPYVKIPVFERIKYPIPGTEDEYYENRLDLESIKYYHQFNFKEAIKNVGYKEE